MNGNNIIPPPHDRPWGKEITFDEAKGMVQSYVNHPNNFGIHGVMYEKELLMHHLQNPNVHGVRIYNGLFKEGNETHHSQIIVFVDEEGRDINNINPIERGKPCPRYCDPGSRVWG